MNIFNKRKVGNLPKSVTKELKMSNSFASDPEMNSKLQKLNTAAEFEDPVQHVEENNCDGDYESDDGQANCFEDVGVETEFSTIDLTGKREGMTEDMTDDIFDGSFFLLPVHCVEQECDEPFVKELKSKINKRQLIKDTKCLPKDYLQPFDKGNPEGPSKIDAVRKIHEWGVTHGITTSALNDLFALGKKTMPSVNWPVKADTDIKSDLNNAKVTKNCCSDYLDEDYRHMQFDVCRNGCIVYHQTSGGVMGDVDVVQCSELIACPKCLAPRFTKCNRGRCKFKSYMQCNPFKKGHSLSYRVPMQNVYYRSIMAKLIDIFTLSLRPEYKDILKYDTNRVKKKGKIIDMLDGTEVKKQYTIMHDNFAKFKPAFEKANPDAIVEELSLCVTLFYDGVVNFKRKADSMWPLMCSVVDCNPGHRGKLGTGLFLTLLHNVTMGSGVENYIMGLLATELEALERGILFTVRELDGKARHVFMQVRCVFAHLDTKAMEKFAMVKGSGSLSGCSLCCGLCIGCYRKTLKKVIFGGNRKMLVPCHYLRKIGETQFTSSLEQDSYYKGKKSSQEKILQQLKNIVIDKTSKDAYVENPSFLKYHLGPNDPASPWKQQPWPYLNSEEVWYDDEFPKEMFEPDVRYPHPDTREQSNFEMQTNEAATKYGERGAYRNELNEQKVQAKIRAGGRRPKKAKDCSSHGYHGVNVLVGRLNAFKFSHFCPDYMHYLLNASGYFIKGWKGDRGLTDGSRILSAGQGKHPLLQYERIRPGWKVTETHQEQMDAVLNTLLIAPDYKGDFSVRSFMKHTGYLKARDHSILMTSYVSYLLSFTDINPSYKNFAARYARDLCLIQNPCLDIAELESKFIRLIYETRCIQEGLFPDSEQVFIFHQILDIVHHISLFGHVRGLMCYFGERANGTLKSLLTKGGTHYMKTLYHRYVAKENYMLKFINVNSPAACDNRGVYSDFSLTLSHPMMIKPILSEEEKRKAKLEKKLTKALLAGPGEAINKSKKIIPLVVRIESLCDLDKINHSELYDAVYEFLNSQCLEDLHLHSPFCRLYLAYAWFHNKPQGSAPADTVNFYAWMKKLSIAFAKQSKQNLNNRNYDSVSHLVSSIHSDKIQQATDDILNIVSSGGIYLSDFDAISESILQMKTAVYTQATIKGIKFRGRGLHMAKVSSDRHKVQHNDLATCFQQKGQYSSWCRVHDYELVEQVYEVLREECSAEELCDAVQSKRSKNKVEVKRRGFERVVKFGQFNYFFRLNIPGDTLLNGLAFGSIAMRTTTHHPNRWHYSVSVDSALSKKKFICLNYVCSTSIAVSALDGNDKPKLATNLMQSFTQLSAEVNSEVFSPDCEPVEQLFMIELHPERLTFDYDTILTDEDGTKVLEI